VELGARLADARKSGLRDKLIAERDVVRSDVRGHP
jgi:hypothetical protein